MTDPGRVTVRIYSSFGVRIRTALDATFPAGAFPVKWDGASDSGVPAASGVYSVRATGPGFESDLVVVVLR